MKTIFKLFAYSIEPDYNEEKKRYTLPSYPEFKLSENVIGLYLSLENAEAGIQKHLVTLREKDEYTENKGYVLENELFYGSKENGDETTCELGLLYCFIINEYPVSTLLNKYREILTRRTYSSDGKLADACLVSEFNNCKRARGKMREECWRTGCFPGRKPEEMRFKEGDIVEVFGEFNAWGNGVRLGIVIDTPRTLQDVQQWDSPDTEQTLADDYCWRGNDCSDDRYAILTGEEVYNFKKGDDSEECYDSWSNCTYVMPTRFSVSDELRTSLVSAHHDWTWHPVIRLYIEQIDRDRLKMLVGYWKLGRKMDRQRMKTLLEEMQMPYNGSPKDRTSADCMIADEDMPAYCMRKIDEYADDEERCAAICYGLVEYFEGVEWKSAIQ
jgi:hypothetical protein